MLLWQLNRDWTPNQEHFTTQEKDCSALGRKAETIHFLAKIWGVCSGTQDTESILGKDPRVGTIKRDGQSPFLEAFKAQADKATTTQTSFWGWSCCESEMGFDASGARLPPNLGGFWENHPKGMFSNTGPFQPEDPGALHAG